MVRSLLVKLDSQKVYVVPAEVTGTVEVVTDEAKSYKSISVTLKVYAEVYWSEGSGDDSTSYSSHEDYLKEEIVLWNTEQIPNRILEPGQHVFPFKFSLTRKLPSSFDGSYGHIKYDVEARVHVHRSLFNSDRTNVANLKVVHTVDANESALMNPAHYEKTIRETIRLITKSHPTSLRLSVDIPRRGFCVGENIPLDVLLENRGDKITCPCTLEAAIVQIITYRAQGSFSESRKKLFVESYQIPFREIATFQQAINLTASTTLPNLDNCSIISVQYSVQIRVLIYYAEISSLIIRIPITLGNVPSQSLAEQPPPPYPAA